jgi:hypothetical protein
MTKNLRNSQLYRATSPTKRPLFLALTLGIALLATAPQAAHAQSLTTLFAHTSSSISGGALFFDLNITSGITIASLESNVANGGGISITGQSCNLEVWTRSGTASGFETTLTGWTKVSTGSAIANAIDTPTLFDITDFTLAGGVTGVSIRTLDYGEQFTNTANSYSNADLSLTSVSQADTFPYASGFFTAPATWNGTIHYTTGVAAPEPATLSLVAMGLIGGAGLTRRRRTQQHQSKTA